MIGAVKYGPLRAEVIILKHMKNRSGFEYFQTKTDSRAKFERNRLFEAKFTVRFILERLRLKSSLSRKRDPCQTS